MVARRAALGAARPRRRAPQVPGREADPVVITGAQACRPSRASLPTEVVGVPLDRLAWDQIPVQVDEREPVPFSQIYNITPAALRRAPSRARLDGIHGPGHLDRAPTPGDDLDAGDEMAFMAKDSGTDARVGQADPAGVVAGGRVEV